MNAMTKAHQIRKAAAAKWNCEVSEICFAECLRMAWNNEEIEMAEYFVITDKKEARRIKKEEKEVAIKKAIKIAAEEGLEESKAVLWADCLKRPVVSEEILFKEMGSQVKTEAARRQHFIDKVNQF